MPPCAVDAGRAVSRPQMMTGGVAVSPFGVAPAAEEVERAGPPDDSFCNRRSSFSQVRGATARMLLPSKDARAPVQERFCDLCALVER